MNKVLKLAIASAITIFILPAWLFVVVIGFYAYYLFFLVKEGNKGDQLKEDTGITEYTGYIREVGETNIKEGFRAERMYQPTFIVIDNKEYKGLEYPTELSDTFVKALYNESTLYVYENTIIGIKLSNGRTYSVSYRKAALKIILGWFFIILGIPLIALLGFGLLVISLGIMTKKQGKIYIKAQHIPDAMELS